MTIFLSLLLVATTICFCPLKNVENMLADEISDVSVEVCTHACMLVRGRRLTLNNTSTHMSSIRKIARPKLPCLVTNFPSSFPDSS